MNFFDAVIKHLNFDKGSAEFELLEQEVGQPPYFSTWQEAEIPDTDPCTKACISPHIEENLSLIRRVFRTDINPDVINRRFLFCGRIPALAVFMNGMSDAKQINDFIIRDGMHAALADGVSDLVRYAMDAVFTMNEIEETSSWMQIKEAILDGRTAVFLTGQTRAVLLDTRGYEKRGVEAAKNEKAVKGPQEGFTESMRTNVTLIRRIVRCEDLVCEFRASGGQNGVKIGILYREGIANASLVAEVKRRLAQIDTKQVMSAGTLQQLTEYHSLSPVPQALSTERPDRTAAFLMQGHVAVLLEGSPLAEIMPVTLFSLMEAPEDSYIRRSAGMLLRFVRYFGVCISVLLPGYFLAMVLHHQGLLSTEILSTVIASRRMVFEPIAVELLLLLLVFQLIREAGMRVPGTIGQAIGIIGGLILGQAAVSANLASSVILIVVALTGLGSFCVPDYSMQLSMAFYRLFLIFAAWMGGLLGITCGVMLLIAHLAWLKSYGVPFLTPYAPRTKRKKPFFLRGKVTPHRRSEDYLNTSEDSLL